MKCDDFEALHIKMHVHTSNLNIGFMVFQYPNFYLNFLVIERGFQHILQRVFGTPAEIIMNVRFDDKC